MKIVGLRELKNRLSEYVRYVRSGKPVLVTDRGRVVAELRPPDAIPPGTRLDPGMIMLAGRGLLARYATNDPRLYRDLPRALRSGSARDLLDAERGPA